MTSFLEKIIVKLCFRNEREGRDGEKIDFSVIFIFFSVLSIRAVLKF